MILVQEALGNKKSWKQENLCEEDLSLIKARSLDTALPSYQSFSNDQSPFENLSISEFKVLIHLSKNKNIVIYEAHKGDTIVILDKTFYMIATENILNNHSKYSKLDIYAGKEINYITNLQKRITSDLKLLIINKGSENVHNETKNKLPPFCPILSGIHLLTNWQNFINHF